MRVIGNSANLLHRGLAVGLIFTSTLNAKRTASRECASTRRLAGYSLMAYVMGSKHYKGFFASNHTTPRS